MKLRALSCPHCGAPVSFTSARCRHCHAPIAARAQLNLLASERSHATDFTSGATPHELSAAKHPQIVAQAKVGLTFSLGAGVSLHLAAGKPFKDGSARIEGLAQDPDASIDVGLRTIDAGEAKLGYLLQARPALGEIRACRFARIGAANAVMDPLMPWSRVSALRPPGELNRVELLAADSLIQVRINDTLVARLEDARFGYGLPLYGATSHGQAARVTLRRFEYGLI